MKKSSIAKYLLIAAVGSVGAVADMTVDKSDGALTITSSISGTVVAKVTGPNDKVIVDSKYEGSSFTWTPSGTDGAYRYEVRVTPYAEEATALTISALSAMESSEIKSMMEKTLNTKSDYAGGSVEVRDGQIVVSKASGGLNEK